MSFPNEPNMLVSPQQAGRVVSGRLQCDRFRDACLNPQLQFPLNGRTVEDQEVTGITARHQRHPGLISPA